MFGSMPLPESPKSIQYQGKTVYLDETTTTSATSFMVPSNLEKIAEKCEKQKGTINDVRMVRYARGMFATCRGPQVSVELESNNHADMILGSNMGFLMRDLGVEELKVLIGRKVTCYRIPNGQDLPMGGHYLGLSVESEVK